jgi:hypothetical protein
VIGGVPTPPAAPEIVVPAEGDVIVVWTEKVHAMASVTAACVRKKFTDAVDVAAVTWLCTKLFPDATLALVNVALAMPLGSVALVEALKVPLPLAIVQVTMAPTTGFPELSVTCTVIGSKTEGFC